MCPRVYVHSLTFFVIRLCMCAQAAKDIAESRITVGEHFPFSSDDKVIAMGVDVAKKVRRRVLSCCHGLDCVVAPPKMHARTLSTHQDQVVGLWAWNATEN